MVAGALCLHLVAVSLHEWSPGLQTERGCVAPGVCTPPPAKFSRVAGGPVPGQQWNVNGGFCGAFSVQHAALAFGAWISQDLVRRANRASPAPHFMHGDATLGYEVMPSNIAFTANTLQLSYEEWDYSQPTPQAEAYKRWLKRHLALGHPVVWFPMCKGDPHVCYPGSCPGGGHVDHVEPMFGIFSNHSLSDPNVYDDDVILHASDQDYMPYYRRLSSLPDSPSMQGNCKDAGSGFGRNEMFPCFDESLTYGLAVTGLATNGSTLPLYLTTDGAKSEPNVRAGAKPTQLLGTVHVSGLTSGEDYTIFRYDGTASVPSAPPYDRGHSGAHTFTATATGYTWADPASFSSDSAVYYVAVTAGPHAELAHKRAAPAAAVHSAKPKMPSVPIGSGERLPMLSLGTGSGQHANASFATELWLSSGARAIDTAFDYQDEPDIADGIAASGVPRAEIFLTTKIPCGTYERASKDIDANLAQLRVSRVNLTLIHFDKCLVGSIAETWRALEDAKAAAKTSAIGVSNFSPRDLDKLRASARDWPPAINQCSLSIGYHDDTTIAYCKAHAIVYMSYSPLCGGANGSSCRHGSVLALPEVQAVAEAHSVAPAQVALKWIVQQGYPLATAVARQDYVTEDLDLWSWGELTEDEMAKLSAV